MKQYGLSKQKLLGILYKPERKEQGIVPGTSAVMKTNKKFGNKTGSLFGNRKMGNPPKAIAFRRARAPGEIWLMFKDVKVAEVATRKIISAWRYPGISKPGEAIPVPDDIRQELLNDAECHLRGSGDPE
ncbi:MAG: hypothetical protein NT155_02625 [Candidatus Staskawiczbacteria bacterium]|nr:hypothetical protein [Candidatus Staskawiczbacteria bacterium]